MRRPLLCGLGLGIVSPLTLYLLAFTYVFDMNGALPNPGNILFICALFGGAALGVLLAALFVRFSAPHRVAAFLTWVSSALFLTFLALRFGPTVDSVYFRMTGHASHLEFIDALAFFPVLAGFLAIHLPALGISILVFLKRCK